MKKIILIVLLLSLTTTSIASAGPTPMDIIDTADDAGDFTTLLAAVDAAGLTATLKGPGPFTVFAPTDDAFAALPPGTIADLLADIPALTDILLFHVASGELLATDVLALSQVPTLNGCPLDVKVSPPMVQNANIIVTDIICSNGVIHVIDAVMIPDCPGFVIPEFPLGTIGSLLAILAAAGLAIRIKKAPLLP